MAASTSKQGGAAGKASKASKASKSATKKNQKRKAADSSSEKSDAPPARPARKKKKPPRFRTSDDEESDDDDKSDDSAKDAAGTNINADGDDTVSVVEVEDADEVIELSSGDEEVQVQNPEKAALQGDTTKDIDLFFTESKTITFKQKDGTIEKKRGRFCLICKSRSMARRPGGFSATTPVSAGTSPPHTTLSTKSDAPTTIYQNRSKPYPNENTNRSRRRSRPRKPQAWM
ncbi:hypothetical protein PHLGIDRAFT_16788 [Phlebiopsis gigantea 11061_1 CR5-6]|uniref:Uncharacterized protein n=1 Tax=Phlebiopsis gigantea (strain 11061_1 CR5-6) TaxID=745531 RepID=A0A0C3NC35_PHLG1|nr:hypothetical protein PHLGIDRAFT_16788 [Phlebiopsis gigantea 11061_1 CR5-6]